jgi:hypothetical protein
LVTSKARLGGPLFLGVALILCLYAVSHKQYYERAWQIAPLHFSQTNTDDLNAVNTNTSWSK